MPRLFLITRVWGIVHFLYHPSSIRCPPSVVLSVEGQDEASKRSTPPFTVPKNRTRVRNSMYSLSINYSPYPLLDPMPMTEIL